ncbi:MAG: SRPBCC domain-containing protein [Acidimicrobiia bacterium]
MAESLDGTVKRRDGRIDLHFERHFDAPVERLWAAVSEPKLMEGWLYGPVHELEPHEGGKVEILIYPKGKATVYGKVLRYEPPRLIELTWDVPAWTNLAGERIPDFSGTIMRWEVQPDGDGSKLLLTHSLLAEHDWHAHSIVGAWHLHLDGLPALLAGEPIPAFEEPDFFTMRQKYAEFIGPIEAIDQE